MAWCEIGHRTDEGSSDRDFVAHFCVFLNVVSLKSASKRISLSNGEALPKRIPLSIQNCTFSTFDMDKKAKETNGKNAFKLEILPSLQVGLLKTNEDVAPQ